MHKDASRYPVKNLFAAWLVALAACALLLAWAWFALSPQSRDAATAAPDGSDAAGLSDAAVPSGTADASGQTGAAGAKESPARSLKLPPADTVPFDPATAEYLATAFALKGLQLIDDAAPVFSLAPAGSRFAVQVLRRGAPPKVVVNGLNVAFRLDPPYAVGENAAAASGALAPEHAAAKTAAQGEAVAFVSEALPLVPYAENALFAPYPTAEVSVSEAGQEPLAVTRLVLPVSTEMGCRNCHGGPWKRAGAGGISAATAEDILRVHDKRSGTALLKTSRDKGPVACAACHSGQGDAPNLSTAVHGFHAAMAPQGAEACGLCHASSPEGATRFYRGLHEAFGLGCDRCHGNLAEHAAALLAFEAERGLASSARRLRHIEGLAVRGEAPTPISPRQPGVNLPHCGGCHDFASKPDAAEASAFNKWTASAQMRFTRALDNTGTLRCPSCHGAPHALYPAANPAEDQRDNLQPLQYQKLAAPLGTNKNCGVCHTEDMDFFVHHDLPE